MVSRQSCGDDFIFGFDTARLKAIVLPAIKGNLARPALVRARASVVCKNDSQPLFIRKVDYIGAVKESYTIIKSSRSLYGCFLMRVYCQYGLASFHSAAVTKQ